MFNLTTFVRSRKKVVDLDFLKFHVEFNSIRHYFYTLGLFNRDLAECVKLTKKPPNLNSFNK